MVEIGLIAVAARRHGEGDPERAARAAAAAVVYALGAGLVVSVAGELLADTMFRLMSVPPEVARLGHAYLSTWLLGGPLVFGFFALQATFRAAGEWSRTVSPSRCRRRGARVRHGARGRLPVRPRDRAAARSAAGARPRLAYFADDRAHRCSVVARGRAAFSHLHVAHTLHIAV